MHRLHGFVIAGLALLAACGDDGGGEEDIDLEGCAHLDGGPFQDLVTSETRDSSAPGIDDDHVAYTLELPASGTGYVFFGADEAGDFVFFLDQDVTVEFTDSQGTVVTPEDSATSSPACAAIRGRHVVPMEIGTYFLEVSSTAVPEVNVVVEHLDHGDGHDH